MQQGRTPRRQRGQMLLVIGLTLPVLLGAVGVAVDLGFSYSHRREVQNAADAAAQIGAEALGLHVTYINMGASGQNTLGLSSDPYPTGAAIYGAMQQAASNALPPFPAPSGATLPAGATLTTYYLDANQNATAFDSGSGAVPASPNIPSGVRAVVSYNYPTFFIRMLSSALASTNVGAAARAMLMNSGPGTSGGPFIVCGGGPNAGSGNGAVRTDSSGNPTGTIDNILTGTYPSLAINSTYVGNYYELHGPQLTKDGGGCGDGNQFKGLSDSTACVPIAGAGSNGLPCSQGWLSGDRAGPTRDLVGALCGSNTNAGCILVLPVADCYSGGSCTGPINGDFRVVAYAPFIVAGGSNNNWGQLTSGVMVNGQSTGTVYNPNSTGGGFFSAKLVPGS
ncbi:MAG TPA: pilus assembly protein TadG-related protein [Chloroflexota bacterium]|nr:pilus assembly protein TadG-related protein [Chloroflexota bacterium]